MVVLSFALSVSGGATAGPLWDFTITTTAYIPSGYDASTGRPLRYSFGDLQGLQTVIYRYDPADLALYHCNYISEEGSVFAPDPRCESEGPPWPFSGTGAPTDYYGVIGSFRSAYYDGLVTGGRGAGVIEEMMVQLGGGEPGLVIGGTFISSLTLLPEQFLNPVEWSEHRLRLTNLLLDGGEDGFAWPRNGTGTLESLDTILTLTPVALPEPGSLALFALIFAGLGITGLKST